MGELLQHLRVKVLNFFERTSHAFFETTIGQKFLILLSPFFLLPGECIEGRPSFVRFFSFLHLQAWAPFFGGFFFSSALTVLLRTLQRAHVPLIGAFDVEAFNVLFLLTIFNVLLGYTLALTEFMTPRIFNFFIKYEKLTTEPILFWTTRYGGILMICGAMVWFVSGLVALRPSFFIILILLIGVGVVGYTIRKELLRQQQKFIETIPRPFRAFFLGAKGIIFIIFAGIVGLSSYYIYSFIK